MFKTLAARLTFLYLLLFSILSLVFFVLVSYSLKINLLDRVDKEMLDDGQEFLKLFTEQGLDALSKEIILETEGEGNEKIFIRVYGPELNIVATSDTSHWKELPTRPQFSQNPPAPELETLSLKTTSERARLISLPLGDGYILQEGTRLTNDEKLLSSFQQVSIGVFFVILFFGGVIGLFISRRALAGVERVRQTADQISRGNLSQTISFQDKTLEINNLISAINRMQERIQNLIYELQDVTNNVAHDLRSPITRMRGLAETTLTGNQSVGEYRGLAGAVIEECDSLVGMINTMLEIAETDAQIKPLECSVLNVAEILSDVTELYTPVAEDKEIQLSLKIGPLPLLVSGNRSRLQRAFANLLDNALKFTQRRGRVLLTAEQREKDILIIFADTGPGISPADLPYVCERFYRTDRSRSTSGTGLGLSLVQSIISAHKGEMRITSEEQAGTQVIIALPTA